MPEQPIIRANRVARRKPVQREYPIYRELDQRTSEFERAIQQAKGEIDATLRRFAARIEEGRQSA